MHKYIISQRNRSSVNGLINKFIRSCKNGVRTGYIIRCKGFGINGIDKRVHDYMRLGTIAEVFDGDINVCISSGDTVKFYGGDKVDICKSNCEPFRIERIIHEPKTGWYENALTFSAYADFPYTFANN